MHYFIVQSQFNGAAVEPESPAVLPTLPSLVTGSCASSLRYVGP